MGCCFSTESPPPEGEKPVRKCTNTFWIVLFAAIWIGLSMIALWSYANQFPKRFMYGTDSFGNTCGVKNKPIPDVNWSGMDMRKNPYVFHLNPSNTSYTMKLCVKQCADTVMNQDLDIQDFYRRTGSLLFRYDFNLDDPESTQAFESLARKSNSAKMDLSDQNNGFGPKPRYPVKKQRPVINRCVSTDKIIYSRSDNINKAYSLITSNDVFSKVIDDLYSSANVIGLIVLFAFALSLFVAMTVHFFASLVSSILLIVAVITFIGLTGFSWYVHYDMKYVHPPNEDFAMNEYTTLVFAILITIVTIIVLLVCYSMSSRLKLMEALFEETASCLRSIPGLLCQPAWTSLAMVIFLAFWIVLFMGIVTAQRNVVFNTTTTRFALKYGARSVDKLEDGIPTFSPEAHQETHLGSVKHKRYEIVPYATTVHILMLIWTSQFILGCQQMTVASSVATWYFSRDKTNLDSPICSSIFRVMSYHLGSIALGSLLIFVRLILLIPMLIRYYLQKYKDRLGCLICCLYIVECFFSWISKLLDYINDSALTIVAIEGTPYCFSARVAMRTLATNTIRVATLKTLGDFIILLGKIFVTAASAGLGIYLFKNNENINFIYAPVVFASILAFLIAHAMLSIYSMAISIMFLCYSEDVMKNANTAEGLYAPGSLLKMAQADIVELKPGNLTIATEANNSRTTSPPDVNKVPQVGFVYPDMKQ